MDAASDGDEVFEQDGVKLYIDPRSHLYLDGTEIDYVEDIMGSGFPLQQPELHRQLRLRRVLPSLTAIAARRLRGGPHPSPPLLLSSSDLVDIEIEGKTFTVPKGEVLLACIQYIVRDEVPVLGRFCWSNECGNCEMSVARPDSLLPTRHPGLPNDGGRRDAGFPS